MAEWSACQTRNPAVLDLSPTLTTTWICFSVARNSNPQYTLVNSQLVCLQPFGYVQFEIFVSVVCLAPLVLVL